VPDKIHLSIHFPERDSEVRRVIRQVQELAECRRGREAIPNSHKQRFNETRWPHLDRLFPRLHSRRPHADLRQRRRHRTHVERANGTRARLLPLAHELSDMRRRRSRWQDRGGRQRGPYRHRLGFGRMKIQIGTMCPIT
jgi:hypothetical protein